MKVEIYGGDTVLGKIPEKQRTNLQEAVGKEMSQLDDETIKQFEKSNKTLVVDFLDIKSHGTVLDARLFNEINMPVAGKTCFMEIVNLNDFSDPKLLAKHFSALTQKLFDNLQMLK